MGGCLSGKLVRPPPLGGKGPHRLCILVKVGAWTRFEARFRVYSGGPPGEKPRGRLQNAPRPSPPGGPFPSPLPGAPLLRGSPLGGGNSDCSLSRVEQPKSKIKHAFENNLRFQKIKKMIGCLGETVRYVTIYETKPRHHRVQEPVRGGGAPPPDPPSNRVSGGRLGTPNRSFVIHIRDRVNSRVTRLITFHTTTCCSTFSSLRSDSSKINFTCSSGFTVFWMKFTSVLSHSGGGSVVCYPTPVSPHDLRMVISPP